MEHQKAADSWASAGFRATQVDYVGAAGTPRWNLLIRNPAGKLCDERSCASKAPSNAISGEKERERGARRGGARRKERAGYCTGRNNTKANEYINRWLIAERCYYSRNNAARCPGNSGCRWLRRRTRAFACSRTSSRCRLNFKSTILAERTCELQIIP